MRLFYLVEMSLCRACSNNFFFYRFFHPVVPACVNMDDNGQNHGYCSVDFASKVDLMEGFQKNEAYLLSRRVTMRVASSVRLCPTLSLLSLEFTAKHYYSGQLSG